MTTKLENLINPQVMGASIAHSLPSKLRFGTLSRFDDTLEGQAGDSVTIPTFNYIGEAEDLTEGVRMGTVLLTASAKNVQIKQAGKAVSLTDKSALSAYGDPVGNTETQLRDSIADKIDSDHLVAYAETKLEYDGSADEISYEAVVNAVDKFAEEDDEVKILFINPAQKTQLRLDPQYIEGVSNAFMTGVVAEIAGCQVYATNKIKKNADGTYTNFIVKPNATAIYMKRDVEVEKERDSLAKSTIISADAFYAVALENESRVVKFKTLA